MNISLAPMPKHKHWDSWQYDEAVKSKSFKSLLPYPCLLYKWQMEYPKDVISIAKVASHKRHHTLCKEKCQTIDQWMKIVLIQSLMYILQKRGAMIGQLSLGYEIKESNW